MNVDLALRVKRRILAEPRAIDMDMWLTETTCGTVGCIAGHTLLEFYGSFAEARKRKDVEQAAAWLLGLASDKAWELFHFFQYIDVDGDYHDLARRLSDAAPGTAEYAAVVAEAIDRSIERNTPNDTAR